MIMKLQKISLNHSVLCSTKQELITDSSYHLAMPNVLQSVEEYCNGETKRQKETSTKLGARKGSHNMCCPSHLKFISKHKEKWS